jgi:hypothetical protein
MNLVEKRSFPKMREEEITSTFESINETKVECP